jgi:LysM repeat protein
VFAVREGDTLSAIATAFKVSVNALVAANPGVTPETPLTLAQPIKIPPFPATCGAGTPTAAPYGGIKVCRKYAVQLGDSISSIALSFGLAAQDIVTLNSELADSPMLTPGGTVKIPPWVDSCPPDGELVNPP